MGAFLEKRYLEKETAVAFGSGTVEKIADDIYVNLIKSSKKKFSSIDLFKRKRKKYFDNIGLNHSQIRILGMSQPMRIQDLYIPVRVSEEIRGRKYLDEQYLEYINRQKKVPSAIQHELNRISKGERLNAVNVIKNGQFFILLGGPGSGKTTLLKYLLLPECQAAAMAQAQAFDRSRLQSRSICSPEALE